LPNFANSPNLRKFVDALPGLGAANANLLGQYIPLANPDTTTYPDADYYVIGLAEYHEQMNSDLPATGTLLRGYYQINSGTVGPTDHANRYLGPLILARSYDPTKPAGVNGNGKAVRVLFENLLPTGAAGDLFLPVDMTVMGAGMGPVAGQNYTQNRSTIHLHGGATPWISDGTPHQWITPAGETLIPAGATYDVYRKGVSFQNVPDMIGAGKSIPTPAPGDGLGTFYWSNQQSARLMFYHDHAYGITRLNVYGGVAAGYLLVDQVEDDMITGSNVSGAFTSPKAVLPDQANIGVGGVYYYGIPLVIQDKTFVNDSTTLPDPSFPGTATPTAPTAVADARGAATDPLWATYVGTPGGNLWMPHEYMPNENIYDPSGFNMMGRWDYGPWVNPAMIPMAYTLPSPCIIPETYGDTPVVNGCAYPYVTLPPTAVRFRILNACNDRFLNLQFYYVDPANPTEVKMVAAVPNALYPTWPKDGRDGGVPDPTTAGPDIIQIGNEGGVLPHRL
jgi:FtsP/CotA-like multicopper oxidase with cupredoxin domain